MRGKIKWFSVDKGYGFIVGEDGIDRYFAVRDVKGADLPANGDQVSFEHREGNKGPRATQVEIESRAEQRVAKAPDDRVTCSHCGKRMVPRIITNQGSLSRSVCPFCGGTHKDFSFCFIASAVFEPDEPELHALRRIRDQRLRPHFAGRLFIRAYYLLSPTLARWLGQLPRARRLVRKLLSALADREG